MSRGAPPVNRTKPLLIPEGPHFITSLPNPKHSPLAGLYGPYHRPTPDSRPRRDTNHRRSRVLSKCYIPTLFHHYHRGGNRPVIPRTRVSMVWTPHQVN